MDIRQDELLTYLENLDVYKLANVVRKGRVIGKEVTVDSLTVPSRSHSHPTYGSLRQSRTLSRGFICCPRGRYVYVNTGYGYVETTLVWYTSVYIYVLGYISVVPHTTTTPSAAVRRCRAGRALFRPCQGAFAHGQFLNRIYSESRDKHDVA